jgi:NAD(P)-dependent dehydrogenase (short-subunit alcohol dehydrogenase family)
MELASSVALVTGGASGLGAATVRRLVAGGAKVVIADRDETRGPALAAELGAAVAYVKTDITDAAQVEAAVARAGELGPLRIAVGCAGVGWASRTLDKTGKPHELALFQTVININLVGTFNVLRLAAAAMAKTEATASGERGVIVNTASVAAYDGQIGQIAYAASKAGVVGMTLPAARDLAPSGIRVVTIAPGIFDTPMLGMLPEDKRAALAEGVVFPKRLGNPAEYAGLVASIVETAYLNGETIRLDGALRMAPK